jgi:alpha/beta superfamily hydrolase
LYYSGLAYLRLAIENGFNYLLFDFSGSGLSEGKYVSLGKVP